MALQYDAPTPAADLTAALEANPTISANTLAAISSLLNLDTVSTAVVASWDGIAADVTAPAGQVADLVAVSVEGTTATTLTLPDSVADAKVVIVDTDADITLTVGSDLSTVARAAFVAEPTDRIVVTGNGDDTVTLLGDDNVTVDTGNGNDTIVTGAGDDVVYAGNGNDTITTGQGKDVIDGGAGRDVVIVEGDSVDFTPSLSLNGKTLYLNGDTSTISLQNTEFVSFADGHSLSIVANETEATALRLYDGLLGRDADNGGAEAFTTAVAGGESLSSIANTFLTSTEYTTNLNEGYVESLYSSLLGRDADEGGEAAFLNALANGATRAEVAASIATSDEAQTANLSDTDYVNSLYENGLGRTSDLQGLDAYTNLLAHGGTRAEVADQILGSSEATYKANSDFVTSLYTQALGREADADGKANWISALEHGVSQADVAIGIVGSPEAHDHSTNVVVIAGQV
jgi:fructose-specific component phosphotransferase system IIB-like protein